MPELPEVEVVRRGVQLWAAHRSITAVTVHDSRSLRRYAEGPEHFVASLTGEQLAAPQRRGKFLWIPLEHSDTAEPTGQALMIHLGMSGQVLMESTEAPAEKHLKVTLQLQEKLEDDGAAMPNQLRFVDQRIFGGMQISPLLVQPPQLQHPSGAVPAAAAHIAPDPLEPVVDAEWLYQALRRRRTGLKRALLDQTVLSGVGNIYADEALWRAKLHYERRTDTITRRQVAALLTGVQEVMAAALEAGGTSFDSLYVNVNGASGYFDRSLEVYGQEGEACSRCGTLIRREKFIGRSSYFCPSCQRKPR